MIKQETKKEFFQRQSSLAKVAYYLGMIKLILDKRNEQDIPKTRNRKRRYRAYMRLLHPFVWVYTVFIFFLYGFNKDTFNEVKNDIKNDSVWI